MSVTNESTMIMSEPRICAWCGAEAKKLAEQGDTRTIKDIVIQGRKEHRSYGDVAGDYYRALMHLDLEQKLMRWR